MTDLRTIRLKMGWSQAEMARHLNLKVTDLVLIESGQEALPEKLASEVEMILRQAEVYCEEARNRPVLENFIEEHHLGQIQVNEGPSTELESPKQ
ncbi:MAG: hypothetical protein N2578_00275 [Bdellovibrionaceae bacterium]|nr:hypothetical protein [Pseudobdellovibrionaceae bacterium]